MNTILIVTVGGSHQPILRSIRENMPDFVFFLCSADTPKAKGSYTQVTGKGKILKSDRALDAPDLPNIATQAGLNTDQFDVRLIENFDNLNDCYIVAADGIGDVHQRWPDATPIVDYTGGTKSMTAGLAAAALDDGRCEIQLVTGIRADLDKVRDRTEFVRPIQVWDIQVRRRLEVVRQFLSRFDYASAITALEEITRRFTSDATSELLSRWLTLARAYDAWDRFDHRQAHELLGAVECPVKEHRAFLSILVEQRGHGFELVEDLLRNAERRAEQGRFDDAVGRIYRALELTAQTWLQQRHGLETGDLDLARVAADCRAELQKYQASDGKIKIGLLAAWDLITRMPEDELSPLFAPERRHVLHFLRVRNTSLFAHGVQPVDENQYGGNARNTIPWIEQLIDRAVQALGQRRIVRLSQFPCDWSSS